MLSRAAIPGYWKPWRKNNIVKLWNWRIASWLGWSVRLR
jgi:hypothetical protein